ncbi:hypothetical protein ACFO5K_03315 [Nocardia halotolerans]|uniref:Uncharacterized protein n=1 Tax=Nocardia halotolerans TaxID=1755878 RepID=A0ABV8VDE8_9NOCA
MVAVVVGVMAGAGAWTGAGTADASRVWAACGMSSSETKLVATYPKAHLQCGTANWGFRHIKARHLEEWQNLANIERKNWRDIADMAIEKSLTAPDKSGPAGGSKYCYSGQIYLVNHVNGRIEKTVQPTVIVGGDGTIITAYPGGGCRG